LGSIYIFVGNLSGDFVCQYVYVSFGCCIMTINTEKNVAFIGQCFPHSFWCKC